MMRPSVLSFAAESRSEVSNYRLTDHKRKFLAGFQLAGAVPGLPVALEDAIAGGLVLEVQALDARDRGSLVALQSLEVRYKDLLAEISSYAFEDLPVCVRVKVIGVAFEEHRPEGRYYPELITVHLHEGEDLASIAREMARLFESEGEPLLAFGVREQCGNAVAHVHFLVWLPAPSATRNCQRRLRQKRCDWLVSRVPEDRFTSGMRRGTALRLPGTGLPVNWRRADDKSDGRHPLTGETGIARRVTYLLKDVARRRHGTKTTLESADIYTSPQLLDRAQRLWDTTCRRLPVDRPFGAWPCGGRPARGSSYISACFAAPALSSARAAAKPWRPGTAIAPMVRS